MSTIPFAVRALGLESEITKDPQTTLLRYLPDIRGVFKNAVERWLPKRAETFANPYYSKVVKIASDIPYLDLAELKAIAPEGLSTTFIVYTKSLEPAVDRIKELETNIIDPYLSFLGPILTDKNARLSTNTFAQFTALKLSREKLETDIGLNFKGKKYQSRTKVRDVIARNPEWNDTFTLLSKLVKDVSGIKLDSIKKKVAGIEDILTRIEQRAKENKLENITPEVIRAIGESTYEVAKELEFLSLTYYRVQTLNDAVGQTAQHIESVFSQ